MRKAILMAGIFILAAVLTEVKAQQTSYIEDSFDGQVYPVVRIGNQYWLAENMNSGAAPGEVYDYDMGNKATYGILYSWDQVERIVLTGWRLPSEEDWKTLENYISNDGHSGNIEAALAATSGWEDNLNGTDNYGFNALPGGGFYVEIDRDFYWKGWEARWWSSTVSTRVGDDALYAMTYKVNMRDPGWSVSTSATARLRASIPDSGVDTGDADLCSVRLVTDKQGFIKNIMECSEIEDYYDYDDPLQETDSDVINEFKYCLRSAGFSIPDDVFQDLVDQGLTGPELMNKAIPQYHSFLQE